MTWNTTYIGNELNLFYGKSYPAKNRIKGENPVFGSNGIIGYSKNYLIEGPGLIIGRKGSVGEVHFTEKNFWPIDTTYYVQTYKNNYLKFWFYLFKYINLTKMNTHSAVPGLNRDMVLKIKCNIPDFNEQKRIADILSSLDDKIELNNKINSILEQISQAIFKHWFIDFEFPNDDGKPYKSSGGEFIDSELGKIPKSWKIVVLDQLIKRNNEKINYKNNWQDLYLVDLSNMPQLSICINTFDRGNKLDSNIYKLNKFDILYGSIRPYFGKAGFAPINGCITGTIFSFKPKNECFYSFILFLISSRKFIDFTIKFSRGTKMPIINWSDFVAYKVAIPDKIEILNKFNSIVFKLINIISLNINQNLTLENIRDTLLPKLITGKIRVSL